MSLAHAFGDVRTFSEDQRTIEIIYDTQYDCIEAHIGLVML